MYYSNIHSHNTLGYQITREEAMKVFKLSTVKKFGEDIYNLLFCGNIAESNVM